MARGVLAAVGMANSVMALGAWGVIRPIWLPIVRAATRLFGERGYPSTSMRDIADAVGILAGSLYSHISSKEALLAQIVDTGLDRYLGAVLPIVDSGDPPDVRLRRAIKAHVELVAHHL